MQFVCQIFVVIALVVFFLCAVHDDFRVAQRNRAQGYQFFLISTVATVLLFFVLHGAGSFSLLF